jgi:hypothetical protein
MAEWEKEIAELKTDVKYIREDIGIMQKQVRDCRRCSRRCMDINENHGW